MSPWTRRRTLRALPALAGALGGCSGFIESDDYALPLATAWQLPRHDGPSPVVRSADGSLLVGSTFAFAGDSLLTAIDPATGETRWSVTTSKKGEVSPVGVDAEYAYLLSRNETLFAVDYRRGEIAWTAPVEGLDRAAPSAVSFAPVPIGDRVVVPISGLRDDRPDRLVGVARADGTRRFEYGLAAGLGGAPGSDAGGTLVPLLDGTLRRVAADGTEQWRRDVGGPLSPVAVADGIAYVGSATEELLAVDAERGEVRWRRPLSNTIFTRPLVADGRVYVGGADYGLYAFDAASGERHWRAELPNAVTSGPALVDDRLVTLVGGRHRVRGPSGTVPFEPTALTVHETDGTHVRTATVEGYQSGGSPTWVTAVGDGLYLGQERQVSRLAPEVYTDA